MSEDENLKDEVKEKLNILSSGRYPHLMPISNARPIDKLDTISEVNTVDSLTSTDQSEEELELSGTVRSYRDRNSTNMLNKRIIETTDTKSIETTNRFKSVRVRNHCT